MTNCRNMETLIASSLYESLDAADQSALDAHLAACAACRAEHAELQAMVGAMPTGRAVFEGDLLPAIREELRRGTPPGWLNGWMRYLAGSFVALGVGLSVFVVLGDNKSPERVVVAPSKFEATLAEVDVDHFVMLGRDAVEGVEAVVVHAGVERFGDIAQADGAAAG